MSCKIRGKSVRWQTQAPRPTRRHPKGRPGRSVHSLGAETSGRGAPRAASGETTHKGPAGEARAHPGGSPRTRGAGQEGRPRPPSEGAGGRGAGDNKACAAAAPSQSPTPRSHAVVGRVRPPTLENQRAPRPTPPRGGATPGARRAGRAGSTSGATPSAPAPSQAQPRRGRRARRRPTRSRPHPGVLGRAPRRALTGNPGLPRWLPAAALHSRRPRSSADPLPGSAPPSLGVGPTDHVTARAAAQPPAPQRVGGRRPLRMRAPRCAQSP